MPGGKDKKRIYIAFYPQTGQESGASFHSALLLCPKPTSTSTSTSTSAVEDAVRYEERVNRVRNKTVREFSRTPARQRTSGCMAALLLGKIEAAREDELEKVLAAVPIVQNDSSRRSYHWVHGAMQALADVGIIQLPPGHKPTDVWQKGLEFAGRQELDSVFYDKPLPTCNQVGSSIKSEFGPLL